MHFEEAVVRLERAFRRPLPGPPAQSRLAPMPPRQWPPGFNPAHIRHAAGVVILMPIDGRAHIVLTVRGQHLERHGGQVSLPGGAVDPGETFEQAALREAHEEVAADRALLRVLGALTPIDIPVSRFRLHPIVAASTVRLHLRPADGEVDHILEVDLDALADPAALGAEQRVHDGRTITIPTLSVDDRTIWGATAMVLAELLAMLDGENTSM